jgi:hypothetical protein
MASASTKPESNPSIRGPLRYQITTSSPQVQAGRPFSVYIRITNPYDVPAEVIGLNTRLPVEFVDVESLLRTAEKERLSKRLSGIIREQIRKADSTSITEVLSESQENVRKTAKSIISVLPILFSATGLGPLAAAGGLVAKSITATSLNESKEESLSVEDLLSPEDIQTLATVSEGKVFAAAIYEMASKRLQERLRAFDASRKDSVILQPGNSTVQVFTLRTTRAILFSPSTYDLHIQSEYKIDNATNQDSVAYQLTVRAPLQALIIGSVLGSIAGFLLRSIFDQASVQALLERPSASMIAAWVVALIGNVLLGATIVVAFARKKDAQPILAIEDFWGGVFVGIVAGYSGKSLLNQLIQMPGGVASPGGSLAR